MIICPMNETHAAKAAILEKKNFSTPWSEQSFLDELKLENSFYAVALEGDEVIGVCGSIRIGDEADILNVSVHSEYRRRGIAEKMLEFVLQKNVDMGVRAFVLEVRKSNEPARKLYEKFGFEFLGYRKNFYEKPNEDAAIYRKTVSKEEVRAAHNCPEF